MESARGRYFIFIEARLELQAGVRLEYLAGVRLEFIGATPPLQYVLYVLYAGCLPHHLGRYITAITDIYHTF